VHSVGIELAELLADHGLDFSIRYLGIERTPELIDALRSLRPRDDEEAHAILTLVLELNSAGAVELFLSV
jgi:hypothetical protein